MIENYNCIVCNDNLTDEEQTFVLNLSIQYDLIIIQNSIVEKGKFYYFDNGYVSSFELECGDTNFIDKGDED